MGELVSKSRRTLMQPSVDEAPLPELANATSDDAAKNRKTRARRKERSEARKAARAEKMGSSSKWKELSVKVDAMKKPSSFIREAPESPLIEESSPSKPKSIGRSKWAGLKGSMDFIARMKKASGGE